MIDLFQNSNIASNLCIDWILRSAHILKYANSLPKGNMDTSLAGWCETYQHFIQLLVAIGTIGSVAVSLWLGLKQPKVEGVMYVGIMIDDRLVAANEEELSCLKKPKYLSVEVYNHSDLDINLRNNTFEVVLFFGKILCRSNIFCISLKKHMDDSVNVKPRSCSAFFESDRGMSNDQIEKYIDEMITAETDKPINKFIHFCLLYVPFVISFNYIAKSAINQEFKLELNEELIKIVKNRIVSHKKFTPGYGKTIEKN